VRNAVAGPVDARRLPVPAVGRASPGERELRAPDRGRSQLLVHRRNEREVRPIQKLRDRCNGEIDAAEGTAGVSGDEPRGVQAAREVALVQLDEEPCHRLDAAEQNRRARRSEAVGEVVLRDDDVDGGHRRQV